MADGRRHGACQQSGNLERHLSALEHAPWHGWTPTDLVFPFFLFIVGITTELSLDRRAAGGTSDRAIRLQIRRVQLVDPSIS